MKAVWNKSGQRDIILCQNNCSIFPLVKKHQAAIMRVIFLFQFSTTYTLVKNVDQKAFSIFFYKIFFTSFMTMIFDFIKMN